MYYPHSASNCLHCTRRGRYVCTHRIPTGHTYARTHTRAVYLSGHTYARAYSLEVGMHYPHSTSLSQSGRTAPCRMVAQCYMAAQCCIGGGDALSPFCLLGGGGVLSPFCLLEPKWPHDALSHGSAMLHGSALLHWRWRCIIPVLPPWRWGCIIPILPP